jgi:hygromycin-B 4-O-kinase
MAETQAQPAKIRHYRRLAKKIVQHHFGQPPSRIVYRRTGLSNYVFVINHVEGQFVVRISPEPEKIGAFTKELWATQKVREVGVPSPEVLAVGNIGSEPYMVKRQLIIRGESASCTRWDDSHAPSIRCERQALA